MMCGIAGGEAAVGTMAVEDMLDRIAHRGPDGRGISGHLGITHGHVRLALIDLTDTGRQPMESGESVIAFNGEIWNHADIRDMLNVPWRGSSDTEVLQAALDRHGLSVLNDLDGMFAFSYSSERHGSWLVRDRFGKIPLYVAATSTGMIWASERKAFPKSVRPIAVPPGYAFDITNRKWHQWYTMPRSSSPVDIAAQLRVAVKRRLTADVPVCVLISGGLDSSLILAMAHRLAEDVTAFTAVYDHESDDLITARRLCSEMSIPLVEVPVQVTQELIDDAIKAIEIPSKAQIEIAVPCIQLAAEIRRHGFRACLSGEGADELFGGYGNFCIKASSLNDAGIRRLRQDQLAKMSRGNFMRANKAFMAAGIECRLPFLDKVIVEAAVMASKADNPPGKKWLKDEAKGIVPDYVIKRQKDTFQGGTGVAAACANMIANPIRYYNSQLKKEFGYLPKD